MLKGFGGGTAWRYGLTSETIKPNADIASTAIIFSFSPKDVRRTRNSLPRGNVVNRVAQYKKIYSIMRK